MKNYVTTSLETHLFFGRIMKEHSFFLLVGFPAIETEYQKRADWFRQQFEESLAVAIELSDGNVGKEILGSEETVTKFTEKAERQTGKLTGVTFNTEITRKTENLKAGSPERIDRQLFVQVRRLNQRNLRLLSGLIELKEDILRDVGSCRLYTTNYPLLIEHILREARLYQNILMELERRGCVSHVSMRETEIFWNQIMMEHAQFIRGLLDPTECELIETADNFAKDYKELLEEARKQDCRCMEEQKSKSCELTKKYQQFKTAGTRGITECNIQSVILPLLADHVLREANHYLRIMGCE